MKQANRHPFAIQAARAALLLLMLTLSLAAAPGQSAGNPNSVWISSDTAAFGANEPLRVTIMANSSTPIQGFSFKLAYDPSCLSVQSSQIRLNGLSNMSMQQPSGAVEGIYTSTDPLTANGAIVDVVFAGIKPCDTQLALESASLMALNADRIAVELPGISVDSSLLPVSFGDTPVNPAGAQSIAVLDDPNANLNESSAKPSNATPSAQATSAQAAADASQPTQAAESGSSAGTLVSPILAQAMIAILVLLTLGVLILLGWLLSGMLKRRAAENQVNAQNALGAMPTKAAQNDATPQLLTPARARAGIMDELGIPKSASAPSTRKQTAPLPAGASAYLTIQRGIQAGTRVRLANFPCSLGNSPANDVTLEDPSIAPFHAKIYREKDSFTLVDLGNSFGTYVNGRFYQNQLVPLAAGDVIKIGSIIMTFSIH